MKKIIIKLLFFPALMLMASVPADNFFEGKIIYKNTFTDPLRGVDITTDMKYLYGLEEHFYINQYNYKAYNEQGRMTKLFNAADNIYYRIKATGKAIAIDATKMSSPKPEISHSDSSISVLGRKCKMVTLTTPAAEIIYFYDTTLTVNKYSFMYHKLGNWNSYIEASGASMPLKFIIITKDWIQVSEAISIDRITLQDTDFVLPDGIKIE